MNVLSLEYRHFFVIIFVVLSVSGVSAKVQKSTGVLTVKLSGLKNSRGVIRLALFDSARTFSDRRMHIQGAVRTATVEINDKQAVWRASQLPFGDYAIRAFHDEDGKGRFKVNRLGIPQYEYGFSNNARALFGPPSFKAAKFELKEDRTLSILLHR